jgi:hypothetical protein
MRESTFEGATTSIATRGRRDLGDDGEMERLLEVAYRGRFDAPPREIWVELDARRSLSRAPKPH